MKTFIFQLTLVSATLSSGFSAAQEPAPATPTPSPSAMIPVPKPAVNRDVMGSMSYLSDPKWAVRRNAEFRAAQRRSRLAAMKWYGLSNSRPSAFATPFTGVYSHSWVGTPGQPYRWPARVPTTVIRVEPSPRRYYEH